MSLFHPSSLICVATLGAAALLAAGCENEFDQVRSYSVPKEPRAEAPAPQAPRAMPAAPAPAAADTMQWELPAGWRQVANPNPMRFATLQAGAGAAAVDVSITQLAGLAGGVTANVNRWRGQVGLPPVGEPELASTLQRVQAGNAEGVIVDLTGPAPPTGVDDSPRILGAIFNTPTHTWFIKAVGLSSALEPQRDAFAQLCRSVRFGPGETFAQQSPPTGAVAASPAPAETGGQPVLPEAPPGWTRDAMPRPMAQASYTVMGAGGASASFTLTPLGGAQDLRANVNRWRRQVGLGPLNTLSEQPPERITVAGQPAWLVDVAGEQTHTLAVVLTRGATTWYFKLSGPDPLVAEQREAFVAFVQGVRFGGEAGTGETPVPPTGGTPAPQPTGGTPAPQPPPTGEAPQTQPSGGGAGD